MDRKLSALTGRLHLGLKTDQKARAVGQDLAEHGALSEPPESLEHLKTAVLDDPAFAEAAMALGLNNQYRPARPDETRELEAFPMETWPLRLHEGGMT